MPIQPLNRKMAVKASDSLFESCSCHEVYLLRLFRPAQVFIFVCISRVHEELAQVFSLADLAKFLLVSTRSKSSCHAVFHQEHFIYTPIKLARAQLMGRQGGF